ncbi:carbohydrate kinase family protein [Mobilicoccus pelagius]|uniref:Adenosine kinase n=1 Tax=Mobilicoccus pelagius NBRC 104925 TaxID=1089455 RepID=H5UUU8_9MICO|nr:carbohydrate kinase family protein [Mobilicoccus pelagius]GAB49506.1 adenosine kinase [Mobilicoccus pelagius NBRC 104925]
MPIAVAGSIATDHLMTFQGRFADSLIAEQLEKVSLSFLADGLEIRRGGVGGNISFGMGLLGARPVLVGSAGPDFDDYRSWLERHGVDCESVHISETAHTARFVCTTDSVLAQIATFYPGAMSEARELEFGPVIDRVGDLDLVLIGPDDPEAMLRHTDECRERGIRFAADPSQQMAFMDGPSIRRLIDGATYLFTNEYESHVAEKKTGWTADEIAERVQVRIITRGSEGCTVAARGEEPINVDVVPARTVVDPTGVGDAFRAGFLVGLDSGLGYRHCAQLGAVMATHVVETVGTQEYSEALTGLRDRLAETYGDADADTIAAHLPQDRV